MRIAKQDALRQLIEIVNGVNVTSETTVSGSMFDDVIRLKFKVLFVEQDELVKNKRDTSVEITYEVKMADISRVLLPMAEKAPTLKFEDVTVGNTVSESSASR